MADGLTILVLAGSTATVEDEEHGLVLLAADLSRDEDLVLSKQLGVKAHVAGAVDTVNVSEAGGAGPVGGDGLKSLVDCVDVLGLGIERVVVDSLVIDTVFLATLLSSAM